VRGFHLSLLAVVHAHVQIVQRTKSEIIIRSVLHYRRKGVRYGDNSTSSC
jgi:hypothetical protein